jgi:hypothetical protein
MFLNSHHLLNKFIFISNLKEYTIFLGIAEPYFASQMALMPCFNVAHEITT